MKEQIAKRLDVMRYGIAVEATERFSINPSMSKLKDELDKKMSNVNRELQEAKPALHWVKHHLDELEMTCEDVFKLERELISIQESKRATYLNYFVVTLTIIGTLIGFIQCITK